MKFARYLQDTQTSEWKKAYIDYHALKVQLRAIQTEAPRRFDSWSSFGNADIDRTHHSTLSNDENSDDFEEVHLNGGKKSSRITSLWVSEADPTTNTTTHRHSKSAFPTRGKTSDLEIPSFSLALTSLPLRMTGTVSHEPSQFSFPKTHRSPSVFPLLKDSGSPAPSLLHTIRSNLPAVHAKFFDILDAELDKVETFYAERAKEMSERTNQLRKQLDELGVHRQMFIESSTQSKAQSWAKRAYFSVPPALSSLVQWFRGLKTKRRKPHQTGRNGASESRRRWRRGLVGISNSGMQPPGHRRLGGDHRKLGVARSAAETDIGAASSPTLIGLPADSNGLPSLPFSRTKQPPEPHEYHGAKRRLRNAVVEHYRGLEALNNFRILNLAGFRKALKKYGKITKIPVLDAYMKEKVEPSTFASGVMVSTMLKEMEHVFAIRFEHGDKKRAMDRLRVEPPSKTHHFSTFRSGLWLGLALPAIGAGSYQCFQEYTRKTLPSWNILLFIYSVPLIPILLALLVGINILVWVRQRVSYVFIFKLNPRSKLDHREYFELPSFLLCTLAYAFWFSLAQLGPPMLWPLIWLILTVVVLFNPLRNSTWGHARWWTIKKIAKLGASGLWHVEFTDVWLGDEFCSLVYSLSNLYFVGCFFTHSFGNPASPNSTFQRLLASAYDRQAQEAWSTCSEARHWGWYYLLGTLPFIARFAQNLRRYRDTKLPSQLMNAGKYGMGMIQYFCYCYWRHHNSPHTGRSYILWCFTSIVYTIYAFVWDVWMDWSMGKPRAEYPLLRAELVYSSYIPCYYFALISNLCLRFLWLAYIFVDEANFTLCQFIVALLEMLRRVQWNFYRLEGKHLHNMDLNRITREVPLPYIIDSYTHEEEVQLKQRMAHLS